MPPDPAAYSPHHAQPVGASDRHARCYFSEVVAEMPHITPVLAKSPEERGARATCSASTTWCARSRTAASS